METIYIVHERCYVHAEGNHLRLSKQGNAIATIPLIGVRTVIIFDSVALSAPALELLISNGVDVFYMSKWGKIKARVLSSSGGNAILKLAQYDAYINMNKRIPIVKSIISAKIINQISMVKKYKYHDTISDFDRQIDQLSGFSGLLDKADNINEVLGVEGISARYYWDCFRHLLKKRVFTRREYRPSPDYVNSLLNLGYAFLSNEIYSCLAVKNFDLEIGFLHSIHYGRNSLVLDIMEEFRAPFIDSWVLSLLNKNQLKDDHFMEKNNDWRLTEDGFQKFCELFHEYVIPWRDAFRSQSDKLKNALLKGAIYEPYSK